MNLRPLLTTLLLLLATAAPAQSPTDPVVFAYFKEPGTQGIYLALSRDGYTYTPLNDGQPWLKPSEPGEIMRDIFITATPGGHGFRAVWTWDWRGNAIGNASSADLITWSPQRKVEIMAAFPNVHNTWAPETYWNKDTQQWLLLWSSAFDPTSPGKDDGEGLRLWSAHTTDWQTFSKPTKFFDRGFPAIDATLFHRPAGPANGGKEDIVMILKDQSVDPLRYNERWASAPTVEGPWSELSGPINESWSEGPSALQVGDHAVIFYDHYRQPRARYEAVETTDWIHWTDATPKLHLPEACKHGSFFRITEAEAQQLLARHDAPSPSPQ